MWRGRFGPGQSSPVLLELGCLGLSQLQGTEQVCGRHPVGLQCGEFIQTAGGDDSLPDLAAVEADAQAYSKDQVTDDFVERMYQIALLPQRQASQQCRDRVAPNIWMPSLYRQKEATLRRIDEQGLPTRTLVIWGFNDRSAPLPLGHELFNRIARKTPRAEMHILNGAGHYSYRDQYQAFNRLLTSYCLG